MARIPIIDQDLELALCPHWVWVLILSALTHPRSPLLTAQLPQHNTSNHRLSIQLARRNDSSGPRFGQRQSGCLVGWVCLARELLAWMASQLQRAGWVVI